MNGRRDAQYNRRNGIMGENSMVNLGTANNSGSNSLENLGIDVQD